jgi:signal transduction histidine kinase
VLRRHVAGDPALAVAVEELAARLLEKESEMAETLKLYDAGQHEVWRNLVLTDIGREKMEGVRNAAETLLAAEDRRVAEERAAVLQALSEGRLGVAAMTVLSLLALVLFLRMTAALQRAQSAHAQALQADRDVLELQIGQRTAELTELARHLQTAREDERGHLARELHDELGALLTAAKLDVARLKRGLGVPAPEVVLRLAHLVDIIDQGISLKRRIIEDLRPSSLNNLGLAAALEIQAREFEQRSGLKVKTELAEVRLPDAAQIVVYRVVQESLTNIAKHARAHSVSLSVVSDGRQVRVVVADDGQGFVASGSAPSAHGLLGMRYRVESVGGQLRLVSRPGDGTVIEALIPTPAEPAQEAVVAGTATATDPALP